MFERALNRHLNQHNPFKFYLAKVKSIIEKKQTKTRENFPIFAKQVHIRGGYRTEIQNYRYDGILNCF